MVQTLAAECSTILRDYREWENKLLKTACGQQRLAFRRDLLTAGLRVIVMQSHVTSEVLIATRPSRFSTCNIEKLGMGLGTMLINTKKLQRRALGLLFISLQRSWTRERVVTQYHSVVGYSPSSLLYTLACMYMVWSIKFQHECIVRLKHEMNPYSTPGLALHSTSCTLSRTCHKWICQSCNIDTLIVLRYYLMCGQRRSKWRPKPHQSHQWSASFPTTPIKSLGCGCWSQKCSF